MPVPLAFFILWQVFMLSACAPAKNDYWRRVSDELRQIERGR